MPQPFAVAQGDGLCFGYLAATTRCIRLPTILLLLQDGVLNDAELNAFQVLCFNAPLQAEELVGVKQVVAERIEQVGACVAHECWITVVAYT